MDFEISERVMNAFKVGYLYTDWESGNEDHLMWGGLTTKYGIPTVYLSETPRGIQVVCTLDDERLDTPINKLRAKRAIKKAMGRGRVAGELVNMPDDMVGGIFPTAVAEELATKLASLTGRTFPFTDVMLGGA